MPAPTKGIQPNRALERRRDVYRSTTKPKRKLAYDNFADLRVALNETLEGYKLGRDLLRPEGGLDV